MFILADLIEGLAGRRPSDAAQTIQRFVIDSREVRPGDVFVAFRGEKTDGHLYVGDAFGRGAVAAIVEQEVPIEALVLDLRHNVTQRAIKQWTLPVIFRVDNSLIALQELAKWWRLRQKNLRVIGVTGSVGKSSTKELIATVLERDFVILKSEGNLNNEIGLPLTLLQLEPKHQRAVLEMGMYARGEIIRLAELAQPIVGVITNVGPVHLERLGSIETIAEAKAELVQALPPEGTAILNFDDARVLAMRDKTQAQVLTYGLDPQADLWADEIASEGLEGIHFRLHYRNEEFHVQVPLLGRHSVHTALRAVAVGLAEGMTWDHILEGLQDRRAQLRLVAVPGPNGSTVLDDSYNASPASMIAALNLLAELNGRKIAVLGDMLELGEYEDEGHRMVGLRAIDATDVLVTVGELGRVIAQEALNNGMMSDRVKICGTNEEATAFLNSIVQPGDMILIKGSRGLHMEDIVNALVLG
ncbi:MAG TPA: UDP-N-acetylmuramoyl-tripeptide--D-alanyl-D-alanine ligase [Anaerolineae bacterium]|nr:UDP-N-acetylmuramoyl-tripeptide--D-alanyl-D-alanine ligase [Anaerolineae bacterium]